MRSARAIAGRMCRRSISQAMDKKHWFVTSFYRGVGIKLSCIGIFINVE